MLSAASILILIAFNTGIFWVENLWALSSIAGIEIACMFYAWRGDWRKMGRSLRRHLWFILFVVVCNLALIGAGSALRFGLRLWCALLAVNLLLRTFGSSGIAQGLAVLLTPLKLFRVNLDNLRLILAIELNMISILMYDAREIEQSLRLRGVSPTAWRFLRQPGVFLFAYVGVSLQHLTDLEDCLRLRGYDGFV